MSVAMDFAFLVAMRATAARSGLSDEDRADRASSGYTAPAWRSARRRARDRDVGLRRNDHGDGADDWPSVSVNRSIGLPPRWNSCIEHDGHCSHGAHELVAMSAVARLYAARSFEQPHACSPGVAKRSDGQSGQARVGSGAEKPIDHTVKPIARPY